MKTSRSFKTYENWAPVVGRVFLAAVFLVGAVFKIPGTKSLAGEVAFTAKAGVPLAPLAVFLAFLLELFAGIALVVGWKTRPVAFILALYTALLTLIFHFHFSTPMALDEFMSHLGLIGGLLYISVYGARHAAVERD